MADTTQKTNFLARTLFIAGGIILFIVLVVFIFKLIPMLISGIGSAFNFKPKSSEAITISTSTEIATSATQLGVNFTYESTQAGQYFISYTCVDGLIFDIQSKNGPKRIVCNTPFKLGSNVNSIALIPTYTGTSSLVDTTLTVEYKDASEKVIDSGTKILSVGSTTNTAGTDSTDNPYNVVAPLAGSTVTTTTLPTSTTTTGPTVPAIPAIPALPTRDLTITNMYAIANQSAFVMHVYNYGNTATGPWDFSYTDAESPSRTISSPIQASLGAGQGIAITVRFDGQVNSSQTVVVTLNQTRLINESNFSNNSSSVVITGRTSSNNNDDDDFDGDADLTVTSMEVGRMSGNRFIEDDSINEGDTAAIVFTVRNQGGESTGSWRFEVSDLPYSSGDRTYRSSTQSSLRSGEYREIIVEFEDADEGNYDIEVEVDSEDDVDEERENNNTRSQDLDVN